MKFADAREGHPYDIAVDIIINQRRRPKILHFAFCILHFKARRGRRTLHTKKYNTALNYNFQSPAVLINQKGTVSYNGSEVL